MSYTKTQCLLFFEYILKDRGFISRIDICEELEISPQTFYRYIEDYRAFLSNFHINQILIYDYSTAKYILKSTNDENK